MIGDPYTGVNHNFIPGVGEPWVNPNAFCFAGSAGCPGNPLQGNLGRNALYGPGFADVDLSVFKNFPIGERLRLQLRAEMFNVFNRINLATGAYSVEGTAWCTTPSAISAALPGLGPGEPFNLQIAAKVIF